MLCSGACKLASNLINVISKVLARCKKFWQSTTAYTVEKNGSESSVTNSLPV